MTKPLQPGVEQPENDSRATWPAIASTVAVEMIPPTMTSSQSIEHLL